PILQTLYNKYKEKGFIVLGFPCDQFANQEYEDIEETLSFCQKNYNVSFPIFDKLDVNGAHEHPLFTFLKSEKSGILTKNIKWNFTKFLIDRKGHVVKRFAPTTKIEKIEKLMRHYL